MKIGRFIAALFFVLFLASGASAYTLDDINIENTYGTGENSALLVVDFSDASGDSFAWVINFDGDTIDTWGLLNILLSEDPDCSGNWQQMPVNITYGEYSATRTPPSLFWLPYSSDDLGETWVSIVFSDSISDGGTIGLIFGSVECAPLPETPLNTVPVPAAVWLLGSGLVGLAGIRKKSR